mmetsp:Transcript_22572/g.33030  ORF Transcript_22572/g.33030 Transcript_22572/m.33030 type:complete len:381 (-) Transcript_22572:380-1522(-)
MNVAANELPYVWTKLTRLLYCNVWMDCLGLVRLEILGEPIHHGVDSLIHSILLHNSTFIASPFLIIPSEPTNGMETISLEDITSMKSTVVIHEKNVTRFHGKRSDMFLTGPLNFAAVLQTQWIHGIRIKYLRHSNLGHATRSAIAKLACMIMGIVEPYGKSRHGMPIDGRFRRFDRLQPSRLSIRLVKHLQIHIELGRDRFVHQSLDSLLQGSGERRGDVEVGHADANLSIVQFLEHDGIHLGEDGGTVGDQKSSTSLGGLLEAYECRVSGSAFRGGFTVETNVMSTKGCFVDLLVKGITLTGKLPESRAVQRIETGVNAQRFVHGTVALHALHQVESAEPDGSVLEQIGLDLIRVFGEEFGSLGVVTLCGPHLQGTVGD